MPANYQQGRLDSDTEKFKIIKKIKITTFLLLFHIMCIILLMESKWTKYHIFFKNKNYNYLFANPLINHHYFVGNETEELHFRSYTT